MLAFEIELLLLAIASPFGICHVASRKYQSLAVLFMYEKDDQISAADGLAKGCINILPRPVTFFNETETRLARKNVSHFLLVYRMLLIDLLDNVFEPD